MQALMKMQATETLADITLTVPAKDAEKVFEAVSALLVLVGHTVHRFTLNEEEAFSVAEVFPEACPAMALRGLRGKEELSQVELAQRLGISQNRVSKLESGKRPIRR